MKICTDSCLFGAWVANIIQLGAIAPSTILDIGTGTGLLSLLLAQKSTASIDAVEIDEASCNEAKKNFDIFLWHKRLRVFQADIKTWKEPHLYDLIICNPPFYNNDLLSENWSKNLSKHSTFLNLEELLIRVKKLTSNTGHFAVLLPFKKEKWLIKNIQKYKLFVSHHTRIKQTTNHDYFRSMFIIQNKETEIIKDELIIKDNNNAYTKKFVILLKDYYLHL